jgi:amidase
MNDLLPLSAKQQAALIRARQISSVELVETHLDHISQVNPRINAAIDVLADSAIAGARAADQSLARKDEVIGPLHGVPFSIKDSIELAGTICTAGTSGRARAPKSAGDATLVARLRGAGAIPIAKTNLPDLLFAFESDNLLFGRTNNPYEVTRTSGGSSGGEAALIAACGSPIGLGSDAAGSVRVPAAFCGIAGIKPTSGRLPRTGHFPPAGGWIERLWQIGPMARHVEDVAFMMSLLVDSVQSDPTVIGMPFDDPAQVDLSKLRVAFYTDNGYVPTDPEVAQVIRAAANALTGVVQAVREDRPSVLACAYDLEMKVLGADGGDSLRRYLEHLGSTELHPLLTGWLERLESFRTDLAGFQDYWSELDRYRAEMFAFLSNYDAILCPVYTQPALPHGASILDHNFRGFSHTMAYNLTGWPAAVVRCGESAAGLPVGVQIAAKPWREDVALAVAGCLEKAFGGWKQPVTIS